MLIKLSKEIAFDPDENLYAFSYSGTVSDNYELNFGCGFEIITKFYGLFSKTNVYKYFDNYRIEYLNTEFQFHSYDKKYKMTISTLKELS